MFSLYFVVLPKQTTDVKTPPIAHVTQFYNIHTAMSQTVSQNIGSSSSTRSFHFDFVTLQNLALCFAFSLYFPFPCQYPYTNTTHSHSDHRTHHIISQLYLLTPWSRILLEKLTGSAASQEIPRIFGTRRFLTVPTSARHLSLS